MPGMLSNVSNALNDIGENEAHVPELELLEDGSERGRLFVKVIGVKELELPLPRGKI
jgi:hypothetical protein